MPQGICDTFARRRPEPVLALSARSPTRASLHRLAAGLPASALALLPLLAGAAGFEQCGPGFSLPPVPYIEAPSDLPGAVDMESDDANLTDEGVSVLTGDVQIRRQGRHVSADEVRYDSRTETIHAIGNVRAWGEGVYLTGSRGTMALDEDVTVVEDADYRALDAHAHGTATRVILSDSDILKASDARYSTCNPDDVVWVLEADNIRLDKGEDQGLARNVLVRFKGVPIFYSPYLTFPLSDARKSGFLAPSAGASKEAGVEVTVPYYFNIAPNMDATLGVRTMSDRGVQVQGEYRYLFPWGSGRLAAEVLPDDRERGESRQAVSFDHTGTISNRWTTNAVFGWVSDDDYFEELGTSLELSSQSFLEQRADVTYSGNQFWALGRVQSFQTVDDQLAGTSRPYKRLPQMLLGTTRVERNLRFNFNGTAEVVHFDRRDSVTGVRWDLAPHVTFPYRTAAGFVVPKATMRYTGYSLDDQSAGTSDDPSRVLPTFSVDSGLFFERPFRFRGRSVLHTVEPRLFYLFVPFDDQDDLPVFDTGEFTFNFGQLFREDRFSGPDRVGDAHQITLALTTRFIDAASGAELARASIGQIRHFRDRRVTLPGAARDTSRSSDLVAEVAANLDERWRVSGGLQWDTRETRTDRSTVAVRYSPDDRRVINATYRFVRDTVEQTDLSFAWPVARDWRAVGRFAYSLEGKQLIETFGGVEYESCCWGFRLVGRRYLSSAQDVTSSDDSYNTGVFAQIVLKGLAGFGDAGEFLSRSIPGYRNEF